jgi:hypothetical protein
MNSPENYLTKDEIWALKPGTEIKYYSNNAWVEATKLNNIKTRSGAVFVKTKFSNFTLSLDNLLVVLI